MTLWILYCRMTAKMDILFTFYAQDREHAEGKAEEILLETSPKEYIYLAILLLSIITSSSSPWRNNSSLP
jgi:hypothetical protein